MGRTSCALNGEHLIYFFGMMSVVIYILVLMLSVAINPTPEKIVQIILLILLLGLIVIVISIIRKSKVEKPIITDHSLKK